MGFDESLIRKGLENRTARSGCATEEEPMQPFSKHTGIVLPLDRVNVDTDQMVPKQFLKLQTKQGMAGSCSTTGATCRAINPIRISS